MINRTYHGEILPGQQSAELAAATDQLENQRFSYSAYLEQRNQAAEAIAANARATTGVLIHAQQSIGDDTVYEVNINAAAAMAIDEQPSSPNDDYDGG